MKAIIFIRALQNLQKTVFTSKDISRLIQKSAEYTRLYVYRLKSKGYITEIEKGKYTLSSDRYEVGSNLVFPSYVCFLSAYHLHGLTTQIPITIQVISNKPRKPFSFAEMNIQFITFQEKKMFGYSKQRVREKYLFVADTEKAIIDSLYLPVHCPLSETFEAIQSKEIKTQKLVQYALLMNSIVTIKRLGYLLEKIGINIYPEIKSKLNSRYDLLNPLLKRTKYNSTRWKLNINEELG